MRFQFSTANQIYFGEGISREILPTVTALGKNILVISGRYHAIADRIIGILEDLGAKTCLYLVDREPDLEVITQGVNLARSGASDVVVAIGGGSVMDTGKSISGLAANPGDLIEYLEVVGGGKQFTKTGPPVVAMPTTAGTGAEVTRNAVVSVPERQVKVSLRSPFLMPRLAVVDPELTYSLPPQVTASTGMDALTQLVEPFLSKRANPFTDLFCRDGIRRVGRSLLAAFRDGGDNPARADMSYASLLGGLALANAGLGAVHGFAGVIGGMYQAGHGSICARLLSPVIQTNFAILKKQNADPVLLSKFDEAAQLATGKSTATVAELVDWVEGLCAEMNIPRLRDFGVPLSDFEKIVDQAEVASSMKANPVVLDRESLIHVLTEAW